MAGNLPVQLPDLSQLLGGVGGYAMGQQKDMAFRNNQMNQDAALQDLLFQQQNDPIKIRQAGLNADTTAAQLPGWEADSADKQRTMKVKQGIPIDVETKAKLTDMYTKMSDDEVKQLDNTLAKNLQSPDPAVREAATQTLQLTKEFQAARLHAKYAADRADALAKNNAASALALEKARIEAGKYKKTGKASSMELTITNAKTARERHQALIDAATVAKQDGDDSLAESYLARAENIRPQAEAELAAAQPRPGAVNVGAATGLATNPGLPIAPPAAAASAPKTQPKTPAEAEAAGWKVHVDAKGNKAYVSPDKKSFIEIK